jgi:hypothetical protein
MAMENGVRAKATAMFVPTVGRQRHLQQRQKRIAAGLETPQCAEAHAFQTSRLYGYVGQGEVT